MHNRFLSSVSISVLAFASQAILALGVTSDAQAQTIMTFGPNIELDQLNKANDGARRSE